jgi:FkbM family methyltransferase
MALRDRPIELSNDLAVKLWPRGATAFDCWSRTRFEKHELNLVLSSLQRGMTFVDVGSNAGLFAISAAATCTDLTIYAFEPCSSTYRLLLDNIELNKVPNVIAVNSALGRERGETLLQLNAGGRDGLNTIGKPTHSDCRIIGSELVPVQSLDDYVRENAVSRVDVMKVDVEGAELLGFEGATRLLQADDAPLIIFENYSWCTSGFSYHPVENVWLLESFGYTVHSLDEASGDLVSYPTHGDYSAMAVALKPHHRRRLSSISTAAI